MTETVSHGIVIEPWLPQRPLAIGRPTPEYEIRVLGPDGRTPAGPEETGALEIRADATAGSYDEDGWFHTGDLVTVHADGWIAFADRAKDMLRVGSENVAASGIERVIAEVPGVAETAVVARPDVKLDEVPVAFVAACAAKLADFEVPHEVTVVAALPRPTISEVNKAALRTFLTSGDPLEQTGRNWLAEAAAGPSGDAP